MAMTGKFMCAKCQVYFEPINGGLCSICGRLLCSAHLNFIKKGGNTEPICTDCSRGRESEEGFIKLVED